MNRGPLIFLGIFAALAFSWVGIVLTSQVQFGGLTPYFDPDTAQLLPHKPSGMAARGSRVYEDLGCIECHTQQVRRPGYGGDEGRHWGARQSVARDYIFQPRVLLGSLRTGPDLANEAVRHDSAKWQYLHLFDPQLTSPTSIMPPNPFLFVYRRAKNGRFSPLALKLPADYARRHGLDKPGYELVPTPRAVALVDYLLSLKDTFEFPEAKPYSPPKKEGST